MSYSPKYDLLLTRDDVFILEVAGSRSWKVTPSAKGSGTFNQDCQNLRRDFTTFPEEHWSNGKVVANWSGPSMLMHSDFTIRLVLGEIPTWLSHYLVESQSENSSN